MGIGRDVSRLEELEKTLFSFTGHGRMERCLDVMREFDAFLGKPHCAFCSILVGGTNGKGSTAWKMAAALEADGCKVGLYTSPHISSFRERILVDRQPIEESFICDFLPKLFAFSEKTSIRPTFFELLTALALQYFRQQGVEIAVLEVGLGGRLDATNVVDPVLSVITSIAKDHCELLGSELDQIAYEKAGIIRPSVPVVIGPKARLSPILDAAQGRYAIADAAEGFYDLQNSAIAQKALEQLGVSEKAIASGIRVRPPCRFERIGPGPRILDVAHNPDGFAALKIAIEQFYPGRRFTVVLGLSASKDEAGCASEIRPIASTILCTANGHPRLRAAEDLARKVGGRPIAGLSQLSGMEGPLLVCGSFFIMDEARRVFSEAAGSREGWASQAC